MQHCPTRRFALHLISHTRANRWSAPRASNRTPAARHHHRARWLPRSSPCSGGHSQSGVVHTSCVLTALKFQVYGCIRALEVKLLLVCASRNPPCTTCGLMGEPVSRGDSWTCMHQRRSGRTHWRNGRAAYYSTLLVLAIRVVTGTVTSDHDSARRSVWAATGPLAFQWLGGGSIFRRGEPLPAVS